MTTALTPLCNVAKLATIAQRFVTTTPAPEPAIITLHPRAHRIDIQPTIGPDPVSVLGCLLIWTHRLTGITGTWWHTAGNDLHITLTGRGPAGVRIRVYSSFAYHHARPHVSLAKGDTESVTPDELYRLALELRVQKGHPS
jgi:hypothetical protein